MAHILAELAGAVGTVTFDHQHRRNALSHALVEEVIAALRRFGEARARVVILRARPGARVFSAGHDIDELPEARRDPLGWDDPLRRLVREIEGFPGPVIAMVEGSVWGGGTETVLACDMIVAADTATFAVTPAKLGLPYNIGGMLTFLNAVSMHVAKEMIFTAQPVEAARAHRLGMINHVVPAAELEQFSIQLGVA
jgi:methylmalonyl-CoA decarboxylase